MYAIENYDTECLQTKERTDPKAEALVVFAAVYLFCCRNKVPYFIMENKTPGNEMIDAKLIRLDYLICEDVRFRICIKI